MCRRTYQDGVTSVVSKEQNLKTIRPSRVLVWTTVIGLTYKRQPGWRTKRKYQSNNYLSDSRRQPSFSYRQDPKEAEPFSSPKRDVAREAGSKGKNEPIEASKENRPPDKVIVNDNYPDQPITIRGNLFKECRTVLIKGVSFPTLNRYHKELEPSEGSHEKTRPKMHLQNARSKKISQEKKFKGKWNAWNKRRDFPHSQKGSKRHTYLLRKEGSRILESEHPNQRRSQERKGHMFKRSSIRRKRIRKRPNLFRRQKEMSLERQEAKGRMSQLRLPKKTGLQISWRMFIDFKDPNKACPKDLYPLPDIDWKIESLMRFKYKCFVDAYKGYHQIHMSRKDEEKIAFYTDEGVFSYTKCPLD
nr:reverse transcriptase domain-containing protein [Tanacetum cinerariifolium]